MSLIERCNQWTMEKPGDSTGRTKTANIIKTEVFVGVFLNSTFFSVKSKKENNNTEL